MEQDYKAEPIKAAIVDREGDYLLKVVSTIIGQTKEGAKYYRIKCLINANGFPEVSIFLTDGRNFNSNATAFFDTFGIERGNFNTDSWIAHKGWMHIQLKQGEKYMNMVPLYILDEEGWVRKPEQNQNVTQQSYTPEQKQGNYSKDASGSNEQIPDEIPF